MRVCYGERNKKENLSEEAVNGETSTKPKESEGVDNGEEDNSKVIMDKN